MNQPKDDSKIISKENAARLQKCTLGLGSCTGLSNGFKDFLKKEPYCSKDVDKLINSYSAVLSRQQQILLNMIMSNSGSLSREGLQNFNELYSQVLRFSFAAGLLYGKARVEQDFAGQLDQIIEGQRLEDLDGMIQDIVNPPPSEFDIGLDFDIGTEEEPPQEQP